MVKRDTLFTEPEQLIEGLPPKYDFNSLIEYNSDFYFEESYFKEYVMRGSLHNAFNNEKHNESSGILLDDQYFLNRSYNNNYWSLSPI